MARTYQSEGWYKFPPLWSVGTEVSCRGQFRIAAMSVTAVLEGRVLNSRPVTLLYTYLPCPSLPQPTPLLSLFPLFLSLCFTITRPRSFLPVALSISLLSNSEYHGPARFFYEREEGTRPGSANGHARPIGNNKAHRPRVLFHFRIETIKTYRVSSFSLICSVNFPYLSHEVLFERGDFRTCGFLSLFSRK